MVKMLNKHFGNEMLVAEERVAEYLAAGHKLAASDTKQAEEKPKRKTTTKSKKK